MENGNGHICQQSGPASTDHFPYIAQHPESFMMPQPLITPAVQEPAQPKDIHAWRRTPEGKAKMSAAMKAGWAKRHLRQAREAARVAKAEREAEMRTKDSSKESSIDAAIQYHLNAINTLRAAKALLK